MTTSRSSRSLLSTTGRDYAEWFAALDAWGAPGRPYREIADWLRTEHGLSAWWAQKLVVEYEQKRGLRGSGARPDGTFTGGASKTIAVPVEDVYAAFTDPSVRGRWLTEQVRERRLTPARGLVLDWNGGRGRLRVSISPTRTGGCTVAVEHTGLPSSAAAEEAKRSWRHRLNTLKALLEPDPA